ACTAYWECAAEEIAAILEGPLKRMGHADEVETSLMLAVCPHLVRHELVQDDHNFPSPALRGVSVIRTAAEWGQVGAEGFATRASAEKGQRLLRAIVERVAAVIRALQHTRPDGGTAE
ncbi:MAG: creatininase family protein, partial [Armatimonadota bacterium]|nr:creatininase family protein [Armatimonadota bacterium]